MAKAFECDLCKSLVPGDPLVKLTLTGTDRDRPNLALTQEWCPECLASYQDWRKHREPNLDEINPYQ